MTVAPVRMSETSASVRCLLWASSSDARVAVGESRSDLSELEAESARTPVTVAPTANTPVATHPTVGKALVSGDGGALALGAGGGGGSVPAGGGGTAGGALAAGGAAALVSGSSSSTLRVSAPATVTTLVAGTRPARAAPTFLRPALTTTDTGALPTETSSTEISASGALAVICRVATRALSWVTSLSTSALRAAEISLPPSAR